MTAKVKTEKMQKTLTGTMHTWKMFGHARKFAEVTLSYVEAALLFMPVRYSALSGKGEQREINENHARKLQREMEQGNYTPVPVSVGLTKKHKEKLTETGNQFTLVVHEDDPLNQTDGSHRFEAIDRLLRHLEEELKNHPEPKEGQPVSERRSELLAQAEEIRSLPIMATIYFDGDLQSDFINFQSGRSVDSAHMFSLKIQKKMMDDPALKLAFDIARHLVKKEDSPFCNLIRFDSRGLAPLPISTLCSRSSSDIATSFVGLARVGLSAEKARDALWLANCVIQAYKALVKDAPDVLIAGKILTPVSEGGTKGSATMLIGLATCLANRMLMLGHDLPDAEDLKHLVEAAKEKLDEPMAGNFSGPFKRQSLREFALRFFEDVRVGEHHNGLPKALLTTLSCSTFATEALPKVPKTKKTKPAAAAVTVTNEPVKASEAQPQPSAPAAAPTQAQVPAVPWDANDDKEFVAPEGHTETEPWETEPVTAGTEVEIQG